MMSTPPGWFKNAGTEEIISLARVEQLNPVDWQKLCQNFSSFNELDKASLPALQAAGLTPHQADVFYRRNKTVTSEVKLLRKSDIQVITLEDAAYPSLLREIADPPLWLFYRGSLAALTAPTLTIVGTRRPSSYGEQVLKKLLPTELLTHLTTVSGLAYGVDKAVHQASLTAKAQTVAVLAGGLDVVYPADHANLADRIVEAGGALLSEYPPLVRPQPYRFPIRNRIGAGLSRATVIVEATIKSGTLTTAKAAIDYNRDVFAVPGDITRELAQGPNLLLKHGAILLDDPGQLFEYFNLRAAGVEQVAVDSEQQQLLDLLTDTPLDLDQIIVATGKSIENILGLITQLELLGLVYQVHSGRYQRKTS